MAGIKTRSKKIGTSPEAGAGASYQFYGGPGVLLAMAADFSATADAGTVVDIHDGFSTSGVKIYTQTGNTDLGMTVPVFFQGDADLVAGTATAGVGTGLIFTDGLFVNVTLDVAGPQDITLWFKPLVKKSVNVVGASGTFPIWHGPALWHGYAIKLDPFEGTTLDITFTDEADPGGSGPTVMTKTNYATTPGTKTIRKVVTTTGEDEAGAAVTAAATGSNSNSGIYLKSGLSATLAQGTANLVVGIDALFEA